MEITDDILPWEALRLLKQSYWAAERTEKTMAQAMAHSVCFGVRREGELIAFARVITDFATTFYLCDVIVEESCRGQGVGSFLLETVTGDPRFSGLRGLLLTRDAHGFYEPYGFQRDTAYSMGRTPR